MLSCNNRHIFSAEETVPCHESQRARRISLKAKHQNHHKFDQINVFKCKAVIVTTQLDLMLDIGQNSKICIKSSVSVRICLFERLSTFDMIHTQVLEKQPNHYIHLSDVQLLLQSLGPILNICYQLVLLRIVYCIQYICYYSVLLTLVPYWKPKQSTSCICTTFDFVITCRT